MAGEESIEQAMTRWGRRRGLTWNDDPGIETPTPLLRDGGARSTYDGLVGELRGRPVTVCHYSYTAYAASEGDSATADFTIAVVDGVRSPADGIALHPAISLDRGLFWHRSGIPGWHVLELESSGFSRQYKLAVERGVPEDAVRRLFEPVMIDWCVEEQNVLFELQTGSLVVAFHGIRYAGGALDDLWARTDWLLGRVDDAAGSG